MFMFSNKTALFEASYEIFQYYVEDVKGFNIMPA